MSTPFRINRRTALRTFTLASATPMILVRASAQSAPAGAHQLPELGYALDALEPHIDAKTMEIHHGKHHAAYVTNLNKALADRPDLQKLSVEDLLKDLSKVPEGIRTAVRNHGGGHYNHTLFWKTLKRDNRMEHPEGSLADAFGELFENKEQAVEEFTKKALAVFGSGWLWFSVDSGKKLKLESSPNQDNPLMNGRQPLFGIDLWEHAYYLRYQNRRADYVKAFGQVVNWEFIQQRWEKLTA